MRERRVRTPAAAPRPLPAGAFGSEPMDLDTESEPSSSSSSDAMSESSSSSESTTDASEEEEEDDEDADSDFCQVVSNQKPSTTSTPGQAPATRHIYTILDSDDSDSEHEVQQQLLPLSSSPSRRTSTRPRPRRAVSLDGDDSDSDNDVLVLSRPTPKKSQPQRPPPAQRPLSRSTNIDFAAGPVLFGANSSRVTLEQLEAREEASEKKKKQTHAPAPVQPADLLAVCLAEYRGSALPDRFYDLSELHREWKNKLAALALSSSDQDLVRSLLFDVQAPSHHPLRYFSLDADNPHERMVVYEAHPVPTSRSAAHPRRRLLLSEAQVQFLVSETHVLLSTSSSASAKRARFDPLFSTPYRRQELGFCKPTVIDQFPNYSNVTFKSRLHRLREARAASAAPRGQRKKNKARGDARRPAPAKLARHVEQSDREDDEAPARLGPATSRKRQRAARRESIDDFGRQKRRKMASPAKRPTFVPCWEARPCIRGKKEMRQMILNARTLVKRLSQQTGAILSLDTEGGTEVSELGYALHRWFRRGRDLQEPAANRRLDPFEADLAEAIQRSLAESGSVFNDPDETITMATPKRSEVVEETVIRHFWHPAQRKLHAKPFLLGESEYLNPEHVKSRLEGIFNAVNLERHCLLLIAHAPFAEMQALQGSLGIDTSGFQWLDGSVQPAMLEKPKGVVLLDTQQLMQCHQRSGQALSLHNACTAMGIDTHQLHNAANDGWFAMELLQAILNA